MNCCNFKNKSCNWKLTDMHSRLSMSWQACECDFIYDWIMSESLHKEQDTASHFCHHKTGSCCCGHVWQWQFSAITLVSVVNNLLHLTKMADLAHYPVCGSKATPFLCTASAYNRRRSWFQDVILLLCLVNKINSSVGQPKQGIRSLYLQRRANLQRPIHSSSVPL